MESPMASQSRLDAFSSPLARGSDLEPDQHPNLSNISAGLMFWRFLPVPKEPPPPPEYVHIPVAGRPIDEAASKKLFMVGRWNAAWEAGIRSTDPVLPRRRVSRQSGAHDGNGIEVG